MEVMDRNEEGDDSVYSLKLLRYMERYPNFYFKSSKLAKEIGLPSQKVSKMLLVLHRDGLLHRIDVGNSRKRPYYRAKV